MNRPYKAYTELTLAMIIVGSSVVAGKLIVEVFPVFFAAGLRLVIGSVVLVPLFIRRERGIPRIGRRDLAVLFFQALTGVFLFSVFLLFGLRLTTAAESGIITSTTPAVIGLISFVFLKEQLTVNKALGISLAVTGVLAINVIGGPSEAERGANPILGSVLIFGAVIGEALFTILGKIASRRVSPLGITATTNLFGFLMFVPFVIYDGVRHDFSQVEPADWLLIAYWGFFLSVIAFILWYSGVAQVPASTAGVFTSVLPVSAVLLSYVILGEQFRWSQLVGLIFVLAGIAFITRGGREADQQLSVQN